MECPMPNANFVGDSLVKGRAIRKLPHPPKVSRHERRLPASFARLPPASTPFRSPPPPRLPNARAPIRVTRSTGELRWPTGGGTSFVRQADSYSAVFEAKEHSGNGYS
jgi:hypothetical protein